MKLNPLAFRPGPVVFWTSVLYAALIISLIYVHETVPAPPKKQSKIPSGVNLTEAWGDLQAITANFHPYNSHENDRVREYIITRATEILVRSKIHYTVEKSGGIIYYNQCVAYQQLTLHCH